MRIDVNSFLGSYPFRRVPGTSPEALLRALDRVGIDLAWVSHLPGIFWRDPAEGNSWLYETTGRRWVITTWVTRPAVLKTSTSIGPSRSSRVKFTWSAVNGSRPVSAHRSPLT